MQGKPLFLYKFFDIFGIIRATFNLKFARCATTIGDNTFGLCIDALSAAGQRQRKNHNRYYAQDSNKRVSLQFCHLALIISAEFYRDSLLKTKI